jgi:hypothetical protein
MNRFYSCGFFAVKFPPGIEKKMNSDWTVIIPDRYWINKDGQVYNGKQIMKPWIHSGYYELTLQIDKKKKHMPIHRLLANAFLPNPENKKHVDHINGNRLDNRLSNLRWATIVENSANRTKTLSQTGYKGVSIASNGKYVAKITSGGKYYYLGAHDTAQLAHAAYCKKSRELNGEFHNPGEINCISFQTLVE